MALKSDQKRPLATDSYCAWGCIHPDGNIFPVSFLLVTYILSHTHTWHRNGPKWGKIGQKVTKWSKIGQMGHLEASGAEKWCGHRKLAPGTKNRAPGTEITKIGQKWPKMRKMAKNAKIAKTLKIEKDESKIRFRSSEISKIGKRFFRENAFLQKWPKMALFGTSQNVTYQNHRFVKYYIFNYILFMSQYRVFYYILPWYRSFWPLFRRFSADFVRNTGIYSFSFRLQTEKGHFCCYLAPKKLNSAYHPPCPALCTSQLE